MIKSKLLYTLFNTEVKKQIVKPKFKNAWKKEVIKEMLKVKYSNDWSLLVLLCFMR